VRKPKEVKEIQEVEDVKERPRKVGLGRAELESRVHDL